MSRDLLITLGHNASVIAVEDGRVLNGYESERLTGVKGDSAFPVEALGRLDYLVNEKDGHFDRAFVTHWEPYNAVDSLKSKYWNRKLLERGVKVVHPQEDLGLTHHDAHAHAALAFAGDDFPKRDSGLLVVDGFGNWGEHLSYYRLIDGKPMLQLRVFGYETSLGLMYQYATAFLGMKMHEDEYKLLGYGSKIGDLGLKPDYLNEIAYPFIQDWVARVSRLPAPRAVDLSVLIEVQGTWNKRFEAVLEKIGLTNHTSEEARIALGYVVQAILEGCMANLILRIVAKPENLIMTGGVAYNVALNRAMTRLVPGKCCFFPLAGDQGNAIGAWVAANRNVPFEFGDLCWGRRRYEDLDLPNGMIMAEEDGPDVADLVMRALDEIGFVNLVRGRMEFGPRALCNTTTLAVADNLEIVDEINNINGRNTVMPFAPVVRADLATDLFPSIGKLHRSEGFMICALDYGDHVEVPAVMGAALQTATGIMTGRPQVYYGRDDCVSAALDHHGILINTSFNVHGVPICCDLSQVVHSHQFQRERNHNVRTIVIKEKQA